MASVSWVRMAKGHEKHTIKNPIDRTALIKLLRLYEGHTHPRRDKIDCSRIFYDANNGQAEKLCPLDTMSESSRPLSSNSPTRWGGGDTVFRDTQANLLNQCNSTYWNKSATTPRNPNLKNSFCAQHFFPQKTTSRRQQYYSTTLESMIIRGRLKNFALPRILMAFFHSFGVRLAPPDWV